MFKQCVPIIILLLIAGLYVGKSLYMKPRYINGEVAPLFSAHNISGEQFSLADLKGQYVLLNFWGTWCGPCRKKIPELNALYKKYHHQAFEDATNFEIVNIALEKEGSEARWKNQVQQLGLNGGYNVFDKITNFKFFDSKIGADLYGVKEVPTQYLLNEGGYIMGVNLPLEEVDDLLAKRLK